MNSNNAMIGTMAIGAAAFLLRNKESRDKLMNQLQSLVGQGNTKTRKSQHTAYMNSRRSSYAARNESPIYPDDYADQTAYKKQPLSGMKSMSSANKMLSSLALGAAAYLLGNKQSRHKVMDQLQTIANSENMEKLKKPFQSMTNSNSTASYAKQDSYVAGTDSGSNTAYEEFSLSHKDGGQQTTYKEPSLSGMDFSQKEEKGVPSLPEPRNLNL